MKRLLVISALLVLALAVPVVGSSPAFAKGATDVFVAGPGVDGEWLAYTRTRSDVDLGSLSEATNIYGIFGGGQFGQRPSLTAAELGPRYDLTWYAAGSVLVRSRVYPFAEGGAWAEVPSRQHLTHPARAAGWWHGGAELERQLVELGAAEGAPDPGTSPDRLTTDGSTTAAATDASIPPGDTGETVVPSVVAGGIGAALLLVTVAWLIRRRRTTEPVLTLSG